MFLVTKCVFKHQDFQMISNETNLCHFHPFEVADRISETQLQVGENVIISVTSRSI